MIQWNNNIIYISFIHTSPRHTELRQLQGSRDKKQPEPSSIYTYICIVCTYIHIDAAMFQTFATYQCGPSPTPAVHRCSHRDPRRDDVTGLAPRGLSDPVLPKLSNHRAARPSAGPADSIGKQGEDVVVEYVYYQT